ncbi:MAG TPA: hypothetical protein VK136_09230 [Bacillota bacterium]|nr:hypothetical protein [Bacillota bacterium]
MQTIAKTAPPKIHYTRTVAYLVTIVFSSLIFSNGSGAFAHPV